ncbi:very-short-patch-repair endonuclease [Friedmanniella endophytica]|uniref:Very-short-patch-repair endonuclease n=1 Tax=Microlunatus kandeliicorticis TaxID=1759536 RepID=A0A7W3IVU6_9ACTN|nr:type IV toxin-antitoxin system AbiEi family antitoxin domain-containing protein [Microlunatus kandeliicorticis]MBA8796189.1 very-short-patch-repair endonuclease [Microlunatus kandeliicorticis]
MHRREPVPAILLRLARAQADVVSREQALGCGLGRHTWTRLTRDGLWTRLAPGVARTLPGPVPWPSWAWAGVLTGGDRARLGGRAAGFCWGLLDRAPGEIDVLVPSATAPPTVDGPWRFVRERPGVRDPRSPGDPPRALLEDVAVDLASSGPEHEVVDWLTAAVQTHRTDPRRLLAAVRRRSRLRYRARITALLKDLADGAHNALELAYLREVERAHGLPVAERQVRRGATVADVFYRAFGVLVELDGRLGHTGAGRFRDMRRDNAAATAGLTTLRFGWADVHGSPCAVAAQVAENLRLRGWSGVPTRCSRCRRAA